MSKKKEMKMRDEPLPREQDLSEDVLGKAFDALEEAAHGRSLQQRLEAARLEMSKRSGSQDETG